MHEKKTCVHLKHLLPSSWTLNCPYELMRPCITSDDSSKVNATLLWGLCGTLAQHTTPCWTPYLLSEHSFLSLLSLFWLKARGPPCFFCCTARLTRPVFTHFLLVSERWAAAERWQCKHDLSVQAYRFLNIIPVHYENSHQHILWDTSIPQICPML